MVSRDLVFRFLRDLEQVQRRSPQTVSTYRKAYTYFWRHLKTQGLKAEKAKVSREHVRSWIAAMATAGLKPATVRSRLTALSAMFRWMVEEGLLRGNPVSGIRRPRAPRWSPRGALTQGQAMSLLRYAARKRQGPVLLYLLWQAGGRAGEACRADWQDVEFRKRAWWVKGKGGETRWVPLPQDTMRALLALWEARSRPARGPILLSLRGTRLSYKALWKQVKGWCRRAGVPQASPHWLRHTYVTRLVERARRPEDLFRIQKLVGHASIETTMIYAHFWEEDRTLVDEVFGPEPDPEASPE